jgi:5-formyltetrahydrofolate cyclo-ligase
MLDKTALRRSLMASRIAIAPALRAAWDSAIATRLMRQLEREALHSLGVYWPIRGEPDLRPIYDELAKSGVQLALPVVTRRDAPLEFFEWQPGAALTTDACGVTVPMARVTRTAPQALLMPCVGYNLQGYRLGYGAGYYDRTLAREPRPKTIGVAYTCLLAVFEPAAHDVPMDMVITEHSDHV